MLKKKFLYLFVAVIFLPFCTPPATNPDQVRVRFPQDPESLNPVNYTNVYALQVIQLLFQSLLTVDLADGIIKPVLARNLPAVEKKDSATLFTFEIRKEAFWDNGTPVTANDVASTLKIINCPLVNNDKARMNFEFIHDVQVDSVDNKKLTLVCGRYNPDMDAAIGDFFVLPAYLFDPEGLLQKFTLPQLIKNADSLSRHHSIQAFAQWFNSEKFSRDKNYLKGSSGYVLNEWKAGQYLLVDKKENWWANKLPGQISYITANPSKISFRIIPDNTTVLSALKGGTIDLYENVPASQFVQMQEDASITRRFAFFSPQTYNFVYVGINSREEKFAGRRTRQAIAHLIDVDNIIKVTQENFATKVIAPISPGDSIYYNSTIKPYAFSLTAVEKLLKEAGWQPENGQWFKIVEEEKIPLTITIQYRAGNTEYENIALIFKQSAAQLNIPVEIQPAESVTLTKNLKAHQFEMFIRGMSGSPQNYNFKSILHTESAVADGMNYTGFGTIESDSPIDAINSTVDTEKKAQLLKRLQEIILEEAAIIFLYNTQNRIIVSKRFTNLKISGIKPGSDVSAFELKQN